ncbi:hypothetical protein J1N35_043610 [Gossypium stocksii]|uniref:Uncharacterized protein n=1 Tax=Gossypium stocksii TaxID=47602 RepID=A0A9D3U7K4_9ROSI|nr:hypothetical protein J1N35_043610 [Gossypium stocksii]
MPRLRNKEDAAPSDDYEFIKTIAQQLQEYHSEKAMKQRRKEELEERIRLEDCVDYDDDDDDADELTITRQREDSTLDSEPNFSWLPEELLNEPDKENVDEVTQCNDMDDISPAQSNEESVQLSTSSGGDGDDLGGNNKNACQTEPKHTYSNTFYGGQGMTRYPYATYPGLYGTNAPINSQHRRGRDGKTHGRMREHFHDSFTGSSSRSLATNENEISESSS